jgi:hypothetical protein
MILQQWYDLPMKRRREQKLDHLPSYLAEAVEVRSTLGSRYEDIQSGRVRPMDGEAFFESLKRREDELLKKQSTK